ncbi:hypothetical protein, partial [Mesorhizobium sp.]|uniref:hypothetical protein n=1 Tax=Mesorhizobium sp. TaxID=1871066 RepID=UPI0025C29E80
NGRRGLILACRLIWLRGEDLSYQSRGVGFALRARLRSAGHDSQIQKSPHDGGLFYIWLRGQDLNL